MKYINDIDEQLPPPPYRLGISESRFESHHLMLRSDQPTLQKVINRHLNLALWQGANLTQAAIDAGLDATSADSIPWGKANKRTSAGVEPDKAVRYIVPVFDGFVRLTFARYWRVDSRDIDGEGSSAYTECLVSCVVQREVVEEGEVDWELLRFLGVVYIDDRAFRGELQDPHALPIMLGRESYGLPKGPGQIYYCPHPGNPRDPATPLLRIWDRDETAPPEKFLILKDSIIVDGGPDLSSELVCPPTPTTGSRPDAGEGRLEQFEPIARELGIPRREIVSRFERFPELGRHAWRVSLGRNIDDPVSSPVIYDDLFLYTRLVGLKQFPDPTTPDVKNEGMDVCYCAVVESPLEEREDNPTKWFDMTGTHKVAFPGVHRVDMIAAFAIEENAAGPREADVVEGQYVWGNMVFGNPDRTIVWEP